MKVFEPTSLGKADVEQISHEVVYKGFAQLSAYNLRHRRFDGSWSEQVRRELCESGDAIVVLPYDSVLDCVILVEQFRISSYARGIKPWLVECIAGRVGKGETPEQVAVREAREESGCELSEPIKIGEIFMSPGIFAERVTMFCAQTDASNISGIHWLDSEHEDIRALAVSFDDAMAALDDGRIHVAPAFVCLNWLARHREQLRTDWQAPS